MSKTQSKPKWHRDIPYKEYLKWYRRVRGLVFRAPRPPGRYYRIDPLPEPPEVEYIPGHFNSRKEQVARLRRVFGERGFGPGWRFSYDKGEDLNLRYVFYDADRADDIEWWQHHIRVWVQPDGTAHVGAHLEPTPEDHPKPHLDGVGFSREEALGRVGKTLEVADIPYTPFEWPTEGSDNNE